MIFLQPDITTLQKFYPFSSTKKLEEMRMGIFSFEERWNYVDVKPTDAIHPLQLPYSSFSIDDITSFIKNNAAAIVEDFKLLTANRTSTTIHSSNNIISPQNIFIEEGVEMKYCTLNASEGVIFIGKNALIMEGTMLRGPISIGENCVIKMGAKIYGGTAIANNCTVGGEIKNSIIYPNSNKAHDGYLGDSIIGEWCNLGAGTSNSNIKNTGGEVTLQLKNISLNAGTKFGLLMGDYSRCAINTSFNTGSVVGVCCNIFSQTNLSKYIADFTWGDTNYSLEKAFVHINNWMKFKNQILSLEQKEKLKQLYTL